MAKKKAAPKKPASSKTTKKKAASKSARQKLGPINAPAAPAMMHSAEVGAHVGQDQAIRERLRLYPQATVREIVAMFELDGVKVSPAAVKKVQAQG